MPEFKNIIFYEVECPIDCLTPLINEYGIDELKEMCVNSKSSVVLTKNESKELNHTSDIAVGFIVKAEYIYSEKLRGYCINIKYALYQDVNSESYGLELQCNHFVLHIGE